MTAILLPIQPSICERIINYNVDNYLCRTAPKTAPYKVYIYCTKYDTVGTRKQLYIHETKVRDNYKICDWWCDYGKDEIIVNDYDESVPNWLQNTKYTAYKAGGKIIGEFVCDNVNIYNLGWLDLHFTDLKIYDKPKELGEFHRYRQGAQITHYPNGYMYVEELK